MIKTVTLETAKKLKEAGLPQESTMWYPKEHKLSGYRGYFVTLEKSVSEDAIEDDKYLEKDIAAPTAEEVLDELPLVLDKHCYLKVFRQDTPGNYNEKYWHIAYNENRHTCGKPSQMAWQFETSLAEAAAKMYLYLAEKGLLGK